MISAGADRSRVREAHLFNDLRYSTLKRAAPDVGMRTHSRIRVVCIYSHMVVYKFIYVRKRVAPDVGSRYTLSYIYVYI